MRPLDVQSIRAVSGLALVAALAVTIVGTALPAAEHATSEPSPPPPLLSDTALYASGSVTEVRDGVLPFSPQYALWSDDALKQRWMSLPPDTFIDASDPDRWEFPPGARFWKEFSHEGRRIETRLIERRADGVWQFATYIWNEDGSDAVLAPADHITTLSVPEAPEGIYQVPSVEDCRACHESGAVPVLGVSALQLSPDRDPGAVHAATARPGEHEADLRTLSERGWLRGLPPWLLAHPPRIAARSSTERAALGYLHGNCGNCHNDSDLRAPVKLRLAQSVSDPARSRARVLDTTLDQRSRYRPPGSRGEAYVIVAGDPRASVLAERMHSRNPRMQMPPLGTRLADAEGGALIDRWIADDLPRQMETPP